MKLNSCFKPILASVVLLGFCVTSSANDAASGQSEVIADENTDALAAIAADRYGTIANLAAVLDPVMIETAEQLEEWFSHATDEQLLQLHDATSYEDAAAIMQGRHTMVTLEGVTGTEDLGDISRDLTYTPVVPCRFYDTRFDAFPPPAGGNPGSVFSYLVYGTAAQLLHQGHTAGTGCPSPLGEPAAIAANFTVVPLGQGHIRVWPFGFAQPLASFLNYNTPVQSNLANAGIIQTRFSGSTVDDISVSTWFGPSENLGDVMGYFYPARFRTVTKYLTLTGGAATYNLSNPTVEPTTQDFFCDLNSGATRFECLWNAPLPTNAVVRGIQARVFSSGGTTTCNLFRGTNNAGITVVQVSDAISGWHTTSEVTTTHTVLNSNQSYGVKCRISAGTPVDHAVGYVRIRYTTQSPF